jgi:hypothetical protein
MKILRPSKVSADSSNVALPQLKTIDGRPMTFTTAEEREFYFTQLLKEWN